MARMLQLVEIVFGIVVVAWVGTINAMPLGGAARNFLGVDTTLDSVIKVHGSHSGCRWDRPDGGAKSWHRHVGPDHHRVPC